MINLLLQQLMRAGGSSSTPPVVGDPPVAIAGAWNPPDGVVGEFYSHPETYGFLFTGATPMTYVLNGTPPPGVRLFSPDYDFVWGFPLAEGTYTGLSITATNSDGSATTSIEDITIAAAYVGLPMTSIGFTPPEGMEVIHELIYNNDTTNFTGIQLGLFINTADIAVGDDPVLADVIPQDGTGYVIKTLSASDLTVLLGDASYIRQLFSITDTDWTDTTGYYMVTTGVSPKLLHVNISGSAVPMVSGEVYGVDATTNLAQGASGTTLADAIEMMLNLIYGEGDLNRGTDIDIKLVDASGTEILSNGGYTDDVLSDGTWTANGADATYTPDPSWTATGAAFSPAVKGFKMVSKGTSPVTMHTDLDVEVTVAEDDIYKVNLTAVV